MKLSELLPLLREFSGADVRPDTSGVRSGLKREPITRLATFPYDKDDQRPIWEKIAEVLGSPILLQKAYSPGQAHTGIPGASQGWANDPSKAWDPEEEIKEGAPLTLDPDAPEVEHVPNAEELPYPKDQTDDEVENRLNRIWGLENNPSMMPKVEPDQSMVPAPIYIINMVPSHGSFMDQPAPPGLIPPESAWNPLELVLKKM